MPILPIAYPGFINMEQPGVHVFIFSLSGGGGGGGGGWSVKAWPKIERSEIFLFKSSPGYNHYATMGF